MNDSRLLLQEFHTLLTEYSEKLPMTKMYRDSLIRRVVAELEAVRPEVAPITEVLLCCASGEGSHQFKVVADEAGVMAFLEEMCGAEQDGTMKYSLLHYQDPDNWSNNGTSYNVKLYCAEFSVWKVAPKELVFAPSPRGTK